MVISGDMASIVAAQVQAADFDHAFTLTRTGDIDWALTEPEGVWAPSAMVDGQDGGVEFDGSGWETITDGMSGQYSYNGPIMHPSEYIGRRIGEELLRLAEDGPVTFVAVVVESRGDDEEAAGWTVVRKVEG